MTNQEKQTIGAISVFLLVCVSLTVLLWLYKPNEVKRAKIEPKEQITEDYEPIYYEYEKLAYGTLRRNPKTGKLGVEISKERFEMLRNQ